MKASPLARRIARERGIELTSLTGTGPEGRIVAEDVERAAATPAHATVGAAPLEAEVVPLTSIRRTIARRLTKAWEAPAFQISMSADMTRAQALRERLRDQKVTVTDVLTKLSAIALLRHRELNAQFADDELRIFPSANIGLAVATERGLIVPVLREVERKSLVQLAVERGQLVERARTAKLTQEDLEDGTFTISNLGMYGVEIFTAVLNPPQAAILAVGAIEEKPVVEEGELVVRPMMAMTLTCDHRAVDGSNASEFLRELKLLIEEPGPRRCDLGSGTRSATSIAPATSTPASSGSPRRTPGTTAGRSSSAVTCRSRSPRVSRSRRGRSRASTSRT